VVVCVGASTDPAPLELTEVAGHVVAALDLLHSGLAFRTIGDVDVTLGPITELLFHVLVTGGTVPVPFVSALEADGLGAFPTPELLSPEALGQDVAFTAGSRAPPDQWVRLQGALLSELV